MNSEQEEFRDEDTVFAKMKATFSLWTLVVLILAATTLAFNILVMIGVGAFYASIVGSILAISVGVSQLRLESIESKSHLLECFELLLRFLSSQSMLSH